jgi:hypothetical protein
MEYANVFLVKQDVERRPDEGEAALFHPLGEHKLETILQTWKRFSAREINKLRGKTGSLWQREYWDRLIRSEKQFTWTRNYIFKNPEKLPKGSFELWRRDLKSLSQSKPLVLKTSPPKGI